MVIKLHIHEHQDNPRCCMPLMLDYAAGTLDEAQSLIIATYLSMNASAREMLQACEAIGGELLENECGKTFVAEKALASVLAQIDEGTLEKQEKPCCAKKQCCEAEIPAPLARYLTFEGANVPWQPLLRGIQHYRVPMTRRTKSIARLIRLAPGTRVPDHNHRGIEITLVLEGRFHDETGAYNKGDIMVADDSIHHSPVADKECGCVCLAVTDAPLRFSGLWGALISPFLR